MNLLISIQHNLYEGNSTFSWFFLIDRTSSNLCSISLLVEGISGCTQRQCMQGEINQFVKQSKRADICATSLWRKTSVAHAECCLGLLVTAPEKETHTVDKSVYSVHVKQWFRRTLRRHCLNIIPTL